MKIKRIIALTLVVAVWIGLVVLLQQFPATGHIWALTCYILAFRIEHGDAPFRAGDHPFLRMGSYVLLAPIWVTFLLVLRSIGYALVETDPA